MKKHIIVLCLLSLLASCGFKKTKDSTTSLAKDAEIHFLWKEKRYDPSQDRSVNFLTINHDYIKEMPPAEKAAIAYLATSIGNECWWKGDRPNKDRSNLDCKIITALGLGYQCSEEHLGFLRQWFRHDDAALKQLEKSKCHTCPYTATVQDSFDEIVLTVKNDSITVFFKASGINVRAEKTWHWSETNHFVIENNGLRLVKREMSEVKRESF